MPEHFDKICEFDSEIHDVLVENMPLVFELIKSVQIPNTANTMLLFITKTNFIKEGIFELYESQNLYSMNILFRSLIEHFLRFQYIFFRLGIDKNDSAGEDYLKFCSYSENVDTGKAWKDVARILDNDPGLDPFEILIEITPDLKNYTKQDIIEKINQFRYKNIIRFIDNKLNKEKKYSDNSFLLKIIPLYSELSSFVHGGPSSDHLMMENFSEDIRSKELLRIVSLAFSMTASVKLFSFLMYHQYDKRFGQAYLKIDNIIKKYNR